MEKNKYNLEILKRSVGKDIPMRFHDQFESLVEECSDSFSNSEWDLSDCFVTKHQIEIEPGSKPVEIPRRRMSSHYKED